MPDETKDTTKGTLPSGQSPEGDKGSTQPVTPKTYSESDYQKAVHEARTSTGRWKRTEVERDNFKAELETQKKALAEILKRQDDAELERVRDDPDQLQILQDKRRAREEREAVKREREAFETERLQHAERLAKAEVAERNDTINKIVSEYQYSDRATLEKLVSKAKATSEEDIRDLADTIWQKNEPGNDQHPSSEEKTTLKVDSGRTAGGGDNLEGKTSKELISKAYSKKK